MDFTELEDKLVFIVNGKPRAGKDTFSQMLSDYMDVYKYSSVTKIKEIAKMCGWDGIKDERSRKFLCDLKTLTTEYSDLAYNDVLSEIEKFKTGLITANVFVVDVREPREIERLVKATGAYTIYISNDNIPDVTSNEADANVANYSYDYIISNDGTLDEFREYIKVFLTILFMDIMVEEE